jgi:hypothetical protein
MKGVVFTEFVEMVESRFSPETADMLLDECDLPSGGVYTAVGTYDHTELVSMVVRLSEHSGIAVPDLVRTFGQHMFGRFQAGYPQFFDGSSNALDFLAGIENVIHKEVLKLYPDAQLPRFDLERPDADTLIMTYRSERHLGDLAEGLIQQCITHFGESIAMERHDLDAPGQPVRFQLKRS